MPELGLTKPYAILLCKTKGSCGSRTWTLSTKPRHVMDTGLFFEKLPYVSTAANEYTFCTTIQYLLYRLESGNSGKFCRPVCCYSAYPLEGQIVAWGSRLPIYINQRRGQASLSWPSRARWSKARWSNIWKCYTFKTQIFTTLNIRMSRDINFPNGQDLVSQKIFPRASMSEEDIIFYWKLNLCSKLSQPKISG